MQTAPADHRLSRDRHAARTKVASWRRACVVGAVLWGLAAAPSALAGTARVSGTTISYVAAAGEVNDTRVFIVDTGHGYGYAVRELGGVRVTSGPGCTVVDERMTWCGATATTLDIDLGDGADTLYSNELGGVVHGGPGDDVIRMSSGTGTLYGDAGNDSMGAGEGPWTFWGGTGDDAIDQGCGGGCSGLPPRIVHGGDGVD